MWALRGRGGVLGGAVGRGELDAVRQDPGGGDLRVRAGVVRGASSVVMFFPPPFSHPPFSPSFFWVLLKVDETNFHELIHLFLFLFIIMIETGYHRHHRERGEQFPGGGLRKKGRRRKGKVEGAALAPLVLSFFLLLLLYFLSVQKQTKQCVILLNFLLLVISVHPA